MAPLTTQYGYDFDASNSQQIEDENGNRTTLRGLKTTHTDPNGHLTTTTGYDSQKRPTSILFSDGTLASYTYDTGLKGKVTQLQLSGPESQSITYIYDAFGNVINQTKSLGGDTFSLEYTFDDSGLMQKSKDPLTNKWQEFTYDGMGRLTQITFPINGSRTPVVNNIQYNNANLILSYDLPLQSITRTQTFHPQNDLITQIEVKGPTYMTYASWDEADRANQLNRLDLPQYRQTGIITGNALPYFTQSYRYDLAGNRTQMIHKEPKDTTTFTYEYDKQNQLTAFGTAVNDADPIVQHYSYDVQGNRTQLTQPNTQVNITIDPKANHPTDFWFGLAKSEQSWAELTYDKNGNRLTKTLKSNANPNMAQSLYTYDDRNRMTTYTLNGIPLLTHKYQFSGPRYEKKETQPNGTTVTRFYNDDSLRLLSEKVTDTTGQKAYSYIYMGTQKLARISQNESSKKDEVSYFLTDALGSATFITYHHTASPNDALRITESLLDPWGNSVKNGFFNQTKVQDFTGKAVDEASSLYDFGFRFYDPFLATWIGKDLVPADHSAPLSLNPFLFCLNNPVRFVDPDGRDYEAGPMQGWSFESAFSFAFQMDYGESGKTFIEKAPDRISHLLAFLGNQALGMGGDMIQAVPSSVYSTVELATLVDSPPTSKLAGYLGATKTFLDYKEGVITKQEFNQAIHSHPIA